MQSRIGEKRIFFFSIRGKYFAYDTFTTSCFELDSIALSILPELLAGNNKDLEKKYHHIYPSSRVRSCIKECKKLLHGINFDKKLPPYRHFIQNNIASVCLHIAHKCNLRCEYCYADAGSFGGNRILMSRDVMRKAVDFTLANSDDIYEINIGFFGGEPLLNFRLIRECVEYAKERAKKHNKNVTFSMTSNAVLLTPQIMDFIHRENFSLLFSIDGPKNIHDRMRKFPKGKGTHFYVLKQVKKIFNDYSKAFTVRGTFTKTTPDISEQILYLNEQGFKSISVEPAQLAANHPHSISTYEEISRIKLEYDRMADIYLERFISGKPISFFHFDNCLKRLFQPHPNHTECGAGASFIAITPDGRIFPCFEAVVEKKNCIGHINSGFDKQKRMLFQKMHVDARQECSNCWIKYFCGGGCHAFNIRYNNNISVPYKPQCKFIKYRFKLSAWMLSEIMNKGEKAINKLKKHLQVE